MKNKLPNYQQKFDNLHCCVVIPTYNNEKTLQRILQGVLEYTSNIIIVNDGSTDDTGAILKGFSRLEVIHLQKNEGKGNALKIAFRRAEELGYHYAISIDSDGQLFPDDLPVFLTALENKKPSEADLLIIGARKMQAPDIPEKSALGNRCSSFWFWVETGVKLSDTQCGYRLYPVKTVNSLHLFTNRFELEIEVLVKAAWKGVKIINLPVKVLYDPAERVTHFRPFQDVTRITFLNIIFVVIALFYIAPRNLFRTLLKKREGNPKFQVPDSN